MAESCAPHPEPAGARAEPGWVKQNPLNNDYYVERFKNDPWYPVIARTHAELMELIPGYNIVQIKEKFGGLRYYVQFPDEIESGPGSRRPWLKNAEDVKRAVHETISYAEAWVDGYEYAKKGVTQP